jgi:hypothetical protein
MAIMDLKLARAQLAGETKTKVYIMISSTYTERTTHNDN